MGKGLSPQGTTGELVFASGASSTADNAGVIAGGTKVNLLINAGTTAIGASAQAGGTGAGQTNSTAVGYSAMADVANSLALGANSVASGAASTAVARRQ